MDETPTNGELSRHERAGKVAEAEAERFSIAERIAATRFNRQNMLWETTQAFLAILLTTACVFASLRVGHGVEDVPETLKNALFVVLGFYFGRTNHTRPTKAPPEPIPVKD